MSGIPSPARVKALIVDFLGMTALGPATKNNSISVTQATNDPAALALGATTDAVAHGTTDGSMIAKLKSVADWVQTLGAAADAAASVGGTGTLSAKLRLVTSLLNDIKTAVTGTLTIGGTVTVNEPVSIDDGGNVITVDGTVAVTNSDIGATATVLGATGDAAATAGSTGTISAKARFLTSITNTISGTLTSILGGVGAPSDATAGGTSDGSFIAKIKGLNEALGTIADPAGTGAGNSLLGRVDNVGAVVGPVNDVTASVGGTGSVTSKLRLLTVIQDAISTATGATGDAAASAGGTGSLSAKQRLMTTLLDAINTKLADLSTRFTGTQALVSEWSYALILDTGGGELLIDTADDINAANTVTTASLEHTAWTTTPKYIYIPVRSLGGRVVIALLNEFNQAVALELRGYVYSDSLTHPQAGEILETVASVAATTGKIVFANGAGGSGVGSSYKNVPAMAAGFSHLALKVTPAVDPTDGGLTILVSRYR